MCLQLLGLINHTVLSKVEEVVLEIRHAEQSCEKLARATTLKFLIPENYGGRNFTILLYLY